MTKFHDKMWRAGLVVVLGLGIAACDPKRNDPGSTGGGGAVVVVPKQEDQFGVRFGMAFRADPNSEPFAVNDGDLTAISFTTEPVDIKD